MIDLGTLIFEYQLILTWTEMPPQSPEFQYTVKGFIDSLCEAYGEVIDRK